MTDKITEIMKQLSMQMAEKHDELIVEGLKRKGYTFKNKSDLIRFLNESCICSSLNDDRVFSVNGEPFLYLRINRNPIETRKGGMGMTMDYTLNVNLGEYSFM